MIAERFKFNKREQQEGESVAQYVAQIRKLSENCEFGANLEDSLRDRVVCGLLNEHTQKRLLSEATLTFDRGVEISVAMETATKEAAEPWQVRNCAAMHKVQVKPKRGQYSKPFSRCARTGHSPDDCKFKDAQRHKGKQKGDIKPACRPNACGNQRHQVDIHRATVLVVNTQAPNMHAYTLSKMSTTVMLRSM